MSYGPPPKTPYGDQDFIKEEWNQPQTPQPHTRAPPPPPTNLGGFGGPSTPQPPMAKPGIYNPNMSNTGQSQPFDPKALAEAARSLTQDDILFTRSWRQDSFYYRVLPLSAIASGAYFYYNKMKSLPQKPSRYFLIGGLCYVVGKWSYRDELRKRLEASPSQTPYMQALRAAFDARTHATSGFVSENSQDLMYGDTTYQQPDGFASNQTSFPSPQRGGPFAEPYKQPSSSDYSQHNQGSTDQFGNYPSSSSYDSNSDDFTNKPTTSYDELRARNRGFVPK